MMPRHAVHGAEVTGAERRTRADHLLAFCTVTCREQHGHGTQHTQLTHEPDSCNRGELATETPHVLSLTRGNGPLSWAP